MTSSRGRMMRRLWKVAERVTCHCCTVWTIDGNRTREKRRWKRDAQEDRDR